MGRSARDKAARGGGSDHLAKLEIDEEIAAALAISPMLHRLDFDGRVRQYLHAIRNVSGRQGVREAMQEVHSAVAGKTRATVHRWPAYLIRILKWCVQEKGDDHNNSVQSASGEK